LVEAGDEAGEFGGRGAVEYLPLPDEAETGIAQFKGVAVRSPQFNPLRGR
jgi:hypothetical protein